MFQEVLEEMAARGFCFYPQRGKRRLKSAKLNVNEANLFLTGGKDQTLGIEIPPKIFAIDLDDERSSKSFLERLRVTSSFAIRDMTSRGMHVFLQTDPRKLEEIKPLRAGWTVYGEPAEFFPPGGSSRITFYGKESALRDGPSLEDPAGFVPVLNEKTYHTLVDLAGVPPWKVKEGNRHNFLKIVASKTSPAVVRLMGRVCCDPPLGEDEIEGLASWSEKRARSGQEPLRQGQPNPEASLPPLKLDDPALNEALDFSSGFGTIFSYILRRDGFDLLYHEEVWWEFNDQYWQHVTDRQVERSIRKRLEAISDQISEALDKRRLTRDQDEAGFAFYGERAGAAFKKKCRTVQGFLLDNRSPALVREAMGESGPVNPAVKVGSFLSLNDCVLDLDRREFIPHSRGLFVTTHAGCRKDDLGKVDPLVVQFLDEIVGSSGPDRINLLLALACVVQSKRSTNPLIVIQGVPGSGKSTLCLVITKHLANDSVASFGRRASRSEFGFEVIIGKTLLHISEATDTEISFMAPDLKKITGGDELDIARKFKTTLTIRPKIVVLISTNEDISFQNDPAFVRRTLYVQCRKIKKPKPEFTKQLLEHKASFLTLAIKAGLLLSPLVKDFSRLPRGASGVSELAYLVQEKFVAEPSNLIPLREVKAILGKEALSSLDLPELQIASRLINCLSSSFDVQVTKVRRNFGFCLKGIRERREEDEFMRRVDENQSVEISSLDKVCDRLVFGEETLEALMLEFQEDNSQERPAAPDDKPTRGSESEGEQDRTSLEPDFCEAGVEVDDTFSLESLKDFVEARTSCMLYRQLGVKRPAEKSQDRRVLSETFNPEDWVKLDETCLGVIWDQVKRERKTFWETRRQTWDTPLEPYHEVGTRYFQSPQILQTFREFVNSLGFFAKELEKAYSKDLRLCWAAGFVIKKAHLLQLGDAKASGRGYFTTRRQLVGPVFAGKYITSHRELGCLESPQLRSYGGWSSGYSRVMPFSNAVFQQYERGHQAAVAWVFESRFPGFRLVDLDMVSCHLRITASFLGKDSVTSQLLEQGNFWDALLKEVGLPFVTKRMIKAIVYKAVNGGSLSTLQNVQQVKEASLSATQIEMFRDAMAGSTFFSELDRLLKGLPQEGLFTPESCRPVPSYLPRYVAVSRVLTGVEVICLMALDEAVSSFENVNILAYSHDGVTCVVRGGQIPLGEINKKFLGILGNFLDVPPILEVKEFDFEGLCSLGQALESPIMREEIFGMLKTSWRCLEDYEDYCFKRNEEAHLLKHLQTLASRKWGLIKPEDQDTI
jgi:hypothetical protein